jgi:hypothetical protein
MTTFGGVKVFSSGRGIEGSWTLVSTPGKRRARSASFAANRSERFVHGVEFGCPRTRTASTDAKFPLKQLLGGMLGGKKEQKSASSSPSRSPTTTPP